MEQAAYQPEEEEDFAPRAKPEERPAPPPAEEPEEAPLITDSAPTTPVKPKVWRVRFDDDERRRRKGRGEADAEEEYEEVRTERTPLMPPPQILRDEGEAEESGCKCCCLVS